MILGRNHTIPRLGNVDTTFCVSRWVFGETFVFHPIRFLPRDAPFEGSCTFPAHDVDICMFHQKQLNVLWREISSRGRVASTRRHLPIVLLSTSLLIFAAAPGDAAPPENHSPGGGEITDPLVDPLAEMSPDALNGEKDRSKDENDPVDSILEMDIEQLSQVDIDTPSFDVEVTSVAKQESTVGKSPAAVFVITSEMIRRSGKKTIPELLRMAPGVEVSRMDNHTWAITIRGFQARYSRSLLVMIDGRTVYSPIYSGVYWDTIDMPLEDIQRIEVIRGPGGTLWGANAVNGVINIITKKSQDTQGTHVVVGGGDQNRFDNTLRYGDGGEELSYRVWGKHFERAPQASPMQSDDWRAGRGGFRMDWNPQDRPDDHITFEGDYFSGEAGIDIQRVEHNAGGGFVQRYIEDERYSGANLLGRWHHELGPDSDWTLQSFFAQNYRANSSFNHLDNTFDVEFQHRFRPHPRHQWIWGTGYRYVHDHLANTLSLKFDPSSRETFRYNAFVQDEIALIPERWTMTVGSKFEINSYTDFEYQPSIRSLYVLDPKRVIWGAVSRAVRTPSRLEEDIDFVTPNFPDPSGTTFIEFRGNSQLKSEDLLAYELGYRAQPTERFAWDLAGYFHRYDKLVGFLSETPYTMGGGMYTIYPLRFDNGGAANVWGLELTTRYTLADWWLISAFYTFQDATLYQDTFSKPYYADTEFIQNQARLENFWTLNERWTLGSAFRYVDLIGGKNVPSYIELDLRLGWQPIKNLEFEVVGENLLNPSHLEYSPDFEFGEPDVRIRRAVFAGMTLRR